MKCGLLLFCGSLLFGQDSDRARDAVRATVERNLERLKAGGYRNTGRIQDSMTGRWVGVTDTSLKLISTLR